MPMGFHEVRLASLDDVVPALQAIALLNQAAPVQNTWYTVLDTTAYAEIYTLSAQIDTTNETIEYRLTIDGNVLTGDQAAVAGTCYWVVLLPNSTGVYLSEETSCFLAGAKYTTLKGRSVKFEVRKTTAVGVGNLRGSVEYGAW